MAEHVFLLPDLGEGLESAVLVSWTVAEGDTVTLNQTIAEVETEKALVEVPSPVAGTVATLHCGEGDELAVGAPLVTFTVSDAPGQKRNPVLVGYGVETDPEKPRSNVALERGVGGKAAASPAVRKHAKDLGVNLENVKGTGPEGRITHDDVEEAASTHSTVQLGEGDERIEVTGVRRQVANRLTEAWKAPHVTTYLTVDCTEVESFRREVGCTALTLFVAALAGVVKEHPRVNALYDGSALILRSAFNPSIGVDTPDGLIAPVIRNADGMGIAAIADEIKRLATATRERTLRTEDLSDGTITVSNVGAFGAEYGTPILNPPQVTVLATGIIEPRPLVVDGEVVARPACTLSFSFDHRALDGADAGRAMLSLREVLTDPERIRSLPR